MKASKRFFFEKKNQKTFAFLSAFVGLGVWQIAVEVLHTPEYVLPGPIAIVHAFVGDSAGLTRALLSTVTVTLCALALATLLGVVLAALVASSRIARAALEPWAVVLQVTPVVAIAPLIVVWVSDPFAALVVCATIVAFFPVFSSTTAGLTATPRELLDLFALNAASRWQTLLLLRLPAALPYFLSGLRISGGLALVGAVVAEFVLGAGGIASGLAYRIQEAGYRLQISKMFAALTLLCLTGLSINAVLAWLSRRISRP